jgi:hypothetical protein
MTRLHMHDQVRNRVEHIMTANEKPVNWDEVMQNITTLGILGVFFMFSLPI